jgi:hypothetical protein
MHFFSFDLRDPLFELGRFKVSFQLVTLENVYGLDPEQTTLQAADNGWHVSCTRLSWAGQQQHASGSFEAHIQRAGDDRLSVTTAATAPHRIRAVKILVRDLPPLMLLDLLDNPQPLPPDGLIERYPNHLRMPLLFAQTSGGTRVGFRCEDPAARAKRFAVYQERMGSLAGTYTVECIHEEDARLFDTSIQAPPWHLAWNVQVDDFRAEQFRFIERDLGVPLWEQRADVPAWLRDIRLCLTLHGMHWSGYVFNTYDRMLEIIRFAAERLDASRILAYLPGWEGRYYWQYGDYRPEPQLGGEDGFARLCDGARALGVHVMPMFGGNCANAWAPHFHTFGPSSYMKSATRNVFHGNQPDWDLSRAHDTGWQAWLNPGAPAWQIELARQILDLVDRFGFDAVFLDTVEVWTNDPDFNIREGYRALVARLRAQHPGLLVAGEDWWDGLLDIFPLYQRSGPWRKVPPWVGHYARLFGHICEGDPSRGSTGVFESGYAPYAPPGADTMVIPTLAVVDGSLEESRLEIENVVARLA